MKKFLANIIFFISPILLSALVMEVLLRQIPNDYVLKKSYLDTHSKEIETLILGNSHTFYGIDPSYFSRDCFNASHVSQTLISDLEIFKKYLNCFDELKTIVVPLSYFTLVANPEVNSESWRVKNYVIYYGIDITDSLKYHSEVLSNNLYVNLRRLYTFYIKGISAVTCTESGFGKIYNSSESTDLNIQGKNAAIRHTAKDYKYLDENIEVLNELIRLCRDRNIKVLLITPPAFRTYLQNLSNDQLNKTITIANEMTRQYENCRYFNFLNNPVFISEDFFDGDHLNKTGARKLSLIVNSMIQELP